MKNPFKLPFFPMAMCFTFFPFIGVTQERSDTHASINQVLGVDLKIDGNAAKDSLLQVEQDFHSNHCAVSQGCVRSIGRRKLLRFDGVIQNIGSADLLIGSPTESEAFEIDACHHHPHMKEFVVHQLLNSVTLEPVKVDGNQVVSYKQGFCLMDTIQINGTSTEGQFTCEYQGISAGWSDIYLSSLECQYLDITGVPAGNYILRLTVNPLGRFEETNSDNNSADIPVKIQ